MGTGSSDGDWLGGRSVRLRDLMEHETTGGFAEGPERELFAAVLYDAIQVLLHARPRSEGDEARRYREAVWWVESSDSEYLFSYESVCQALGIDPGFLRAGLKAPKTTRLQKSRKGALGSPSSEPRW